MSIRIRPQPIPHIASGRCHALPISLLASLAVGRRRIVNNNGSVRAPRQSKGQKDKSNTSQLLHASSRHQPPA